jgi:hypothetical protein
LLFAIALAVLAGCTFGVYSYRLKRSADAVVRAAYELSQEGQTPTLQEVRRRFGPLLGWHLAEQWMRLPGIGSSRVPVRL